MSAEGKDATVYVGNVAATITEETLQALFAHCGSVTNVRISGNKDPSYNSRFAFVEFADQSMAHTACMLNGQMLAERSIRVAMAKTSINRPTTSPAAAATILNPALLPTATGKPNNEPERVARTIHMSGVEGQVSMSMAKTSINRPTTSPAAAATKLNPALLPTATGKPNHEPERVARTIHMSGVDGQMNEQHLAQYFSVCGEVTAVRLSGGGFNATRFAWVEFQTREMALGALSLDGQPLGTQQLRISPSKSAIQVNGLVPGQRFKPNSATAQLQVMATGNVARTVHVAGVGSDLQDMQLTQLFQAKRQRPQDIKDGITTAARQTTHATRQGMEKRVECGRIHWPSRLHSIPEPLDDFLAAVKPSVTVSGHVHWIQVDNVTPGSADFERPHKTPVTVGVEGERKDPYSAVLEEIDKERVRQEAEIAAKGRGSVSIKHAFKDRVLDEVMRIAKQRGETCGKWMVWPAWEQADAVWDTLARDVAAGNLGCSAKIAPRHESVRMDGGGNYVQPESPPLICVYVSDFTDKELVRRVLGRLMELGIDPKVDMKNAGFKPDVFTAIGLYSGNRWDLPATIYKDMLRAPCHSEALGGTPAK